SPPLPLPHSFPTRRSSDLRLSRGDDTPRARLSRPGREHIPGGFILKRGAADPLLATGDGIDHQVSIRLLTRDCDEVIRAEVHNRSEEHTSELQSPYDLVCR